ncbi:MAG: 3-isopropylmalate dehydratase [Deltaproteobacteria bacterium]|jgi:3-isopropylmalate/(R)-2-methylmalate dehydratase small subunit|nr:3-isopropylmalate dehydratase [Deltaproteobacteria bacterium]
MQNTRKGQAYVFGDNINTDIIAPPQYMELPVEDGAKYTMESVDPSFASSVKPGGIFVAGNNLGSGSSRETAPLSLRYLQIGALVAQSFARIFYRNAINLGMPAVECPEAKKIKSGDLLEIDFVAGSIHNLTRNETYGCTNLPAHILQLIQDGGLIGQLRKQRGK